MTWMHQLAADPDAVHVWLWDGCRVDAPTMTAKLSREERHRAEAFRSDAARRQFLQGRFLLRSLLETYLGAGAGQLPLSCGQYGKPDFSVRGSDLRFNLSHDDAGIAVALCCGRDVGVDVDTAPEGYQLDDVIAQHFNVDEQASLSCQPGFGFVDIWTAKEAVLKATGEGITGCLRDVGVVQHRAGGYRFASSLVYRGIRYGLCRRQFGSRALAVSARANAATPLVPSSDPAPVINMNLFDYQDFL